jgi:hypothetical protein
MSRPLNLAAIPSRILLLLAAVLLLGGILVALSANLLQLRTSGSHQPASVLAPAPNAGSQGPAASGRQATQATAPAVTVPSTQRPVYAAPPTSVPAAPSQGTEVAPPNNQGCSANPPPGRDIAVCSNR